MKDANVIAEIKKVIEREDGKGIIIYPYGSNGLRVHELLDKCFGIKPAYIVDNGYCKYNKNIISGAELRKLYANEYILLTAERDDLNIEIYRELCEFVEENYIINLKKCNSMVTSGKMVGNSFSLSNILQREWRQNACGEKCKVRFLISTHTSYNAIKTICRAFRDDERFDLKAIVIENSRERKFDAVECLKKDELEYIYEADYDITEDRPDIFVISHPRGDALFKDMGIARIYCKIIVAASMTLIKYAYDIEGFWDWMRVGFEKYDPDYYIFDSLVYSQIEQSEIFRGKTVEMGNAKFDGIYEACKERKLPAEWGKLKGKRILLWNTDHGMNKDIITKDVTFDLYAKQILNFVKQHEDIGLIFRPHPTFIRELSENKYWTQYDIDYLKQYFNDSSNMVWDENTTYDSAFGIADAILTDGYCGIICSALPTLKPIAALYRDNKCVPVHPELVDNYYKVRSSEELSCFLDEVVLQGKDTMYADRKEAAEKYIKNFDGKNGQRIKDYIVSDYINRFGEI